MERASHALRDGMRVWLVDPVDGRGVRERVGALGTVAGVLQLLDRHPRDAAALAAHFAVPLHALPDHAVPGAPFAIRRLITWRRWQERVLWWPEHRLLLVPEAVGRAPYYRAPGRPLGVHPFLRAIPPRRLARARPDHLLLGHGEGLHQGAAPVLRAAVTGSRAEIPSWLLGLARDRRRRGRG